MLRRTFLFSGASLPLACSVRSAESEPWSEADLIQPDALAQRLKNAKTDPHVLYVGFPVLYRSSHIPGAPLAGPGAKEEGIAALKKAVASIPADAEIVIYCGCCPWQNCPNMRPAFRALRDMGYKRVKALAIPQSFYIDWVSKGYPVERQAAKQ